jgi:hypothetical protein
VRLPSTVRCRALEGFRGGQAGHTHRAHRLLRRPPAVAWRAALVITAAEPPAGNSRCPWRPASKRSATPELRHDATVPLRERLRPLQDPVLARPATSQVADQAFYRALSQDA